MSANEMNALYQKAERAGWYIRVTLGATLVFGVVTTVGFVANRESIDDNKQHIEALEKRVNELSRQAAK